MTDSTILEVNNLTKFYGLFCALNDVTFSIRRSEVFGLLGPNGAGKTTMISLMAGLVKPSSGTIKIDGRLVSVSSVDTRWLLGVVPQELVYDPFLKVREALELQSGLCGVRSNGAWIDELLYELGLSEKEKQMMGRLSGGMKRRVMVALALVHRPPVIVLDEPTAGVDVEHRLSLWKFIKRLNKDGHTIVLTTHYLAEAELLCDRLAFMRNGSLIKVGSLGDLNEGGSMSVSFLLPDGVLLPEQWKHFLKNHEEGRYHLILDQYDQLVSMLTDLVPLGIYHLLVRRMSLEDLYVRIMQPTMRDVL
ncbi:MULTISPECIES: ABC transporter ATP-binding protein [Candidatus Ichthyocystis]|uniref:ABC transporter ATP-binding protein n=1 Tax=Candidatus Ichthyocystis hellenicum TaxID=1561003 RepID=A0A0S4LZN9_9BURK|nr:MULTISPECIES: ABC transporter ATP-binding protein [Ichthyocystis]CUT17027.1 ABC transporter ATP-binding protein [Candidatus Ichthyocystis hellenicum]